MLPTPALQLPLKRPLICLNTAAAALDRWNEQVIPLIESGAIRFAWNIGRGGGKRSIRIFAPSLLAHLEGQRPSPVSDAEEFAQVIKTIFPATSTTAGITTIRATNIARQFNCDGELVISLIRDGALHLAKAARFNTGPLGSPAIEFASVIQFLKQRRIA